MVETMDPGPSYFFLEDFGAYNRYLVDESTSTVEDCGKYRAVVNQLNGVDTTTDSDLFHENVGNAIFHNANASTGYETICEVERLGGGELRKKFWGMFMIYPKANGAGTPGMPNSSSFAGCGSEESNTHDILRGAAKLFFDTTPMDRRTRPECFRIRRSSEWNITLDVFAPRKDAFGSSGQVTVSAPIVADKWQTVDFYCEYVFDQISGSTSQWDIAASIGVDCSSFASGTGSTSLHEEYGLNDEMTPHAVDFGLHRISMSYGCGNRIQYVTNVAFTDAASIDDTPISCGASNPFEPVAFGSGSFSPAPEPLPHVINVEDTGGNRTFQRKLQENFDSIQRQLLALDPDTPDSADPHDHA